MFNLIKERLGRSLVLVAIGLLVTMMAGTVFAQQRTGTIVGTVIEEGSGSPLIGANVVVMGTRLGIATRTDGAYTIERVPAGTYKLEFRYVGYKTLTKDVVVYADREATVDAELGTDPLMTDEIVVVGYGSARKEELTGSMIAITSEKLSGIPTTTFQDVIQGTPGVQVSSMDGAPGAGINIRVRGIGSITAGSEPLYVVDGIPMMNDNIGNTGFANGGRTANPLASLNPNDIESLVVLKDAASTAIYGSRGANGVVLITTKGGVSGSSIWASKPKVDFKIQRGYADFAHDNLLHGLTEPQYNAYFISALVATGDTPAEAAQQYADTFPLLGNTDWLKEASQTGVTQSYDLSATGGSDRFTYFVSGSYFDQEGVIKTSFFERYSSRINLTAQLTDNFSIANNINIAYTNGTSINDGTAWEAPFYMSIFLPPAVPIYNEEGEFYGAHQSKNIMGGNNLIGGLYENPKTRETTRIINNLTARYKWNDNLSFSSAWSFDIYNVDDFLFWNGRYGDGRNSDGYSSEGRSDNIVWQGTQTVNYTNTYQDVHNLDIVGGYEANMSTRDQVLVDGEGFAHPDLKYIQNAALIGFGRSNRNSYAFESLFTRVNYDYDKKYYFSTSFRTDGSSRFGPDERWGKFWSMGAGYTMTEESYMENLAFVDYLKFRTSYGQIGNASIGNYAWQGLYGFNPSYDGAPGATPAQIENSALTWESQGNFNIGFDYAIMDNRFSGSLDWYKKTSSDLLLNVPISRTTGFGSILQNFGDMENTGLEVSVQAELLSHADYNLSMNFNITTQNNEITKLSSPIVDGTKRREEGRDYQEYYLLPWAGVDPATGLGMYWTDETKTVMTQELNETDRIYTGKSATPDFLGSFGMSGHYKRFTFSAQANYSFGSYLFESAGRFYHGDGRYLPRSTSQWAWENSWKQPGDIALFPQQKWGGSRNSQPGNSDRYLWGGDFIRLKNVRLAYQLPDTFSETMRVGSIEAYITLNNYYTWVKDKNLHFDPEQIISGVYNTGTPNSKTISFGWNIGF